MTPDTKPEDHKAAEEFSVFISEPARRPGPGTRTVLFAGVAGACLLGVGLGLWARPALNERQVAAAVRPAEAAPKPAAAARKLEIVVDDRPAPIGAPIDVLPQDSRAPSPSTAPAPAPVMPGPLLAPTRPPQGLMRVQDVMPPERPPVPDAAPAPHAAPHLVSPAETASAPIKAHPVRDLAALVAAAFATSKAEFEAKSAAATAADDARKAPASETLVAKAQIAKARTAPPKAATASAHLAKAAPGPKSDPIADRLAEHRAELARAATARATAHRLELAQAAQAAKLAARDAAREARAEKQEALRVAKAQKLEQKQEQVRLAKAQRQEKDRLAKAAKQQQILLAKAEARGRAEARAEALAQAQAKAKADARNQVRLASLVHAVKRAMANEARTHESRAHAAPPAPSAVELARLERRHAKARREPRMEQAALKTRKAARMVEAPRPRAAPAVPPPHASGLMKVSIPRCANRDAGEALVCADPALGAADRQMTRAYQGARAAGVPDAQLQRQQQRWLAARSAAAREAPWAVHDVYLARIAELNGQARDANPND